MKAIIREDEQAVSPVIATILMVAITVVLAAVLYVMVSGLIGGGPTTTKPFVTFATASRTNSNTEQFSVASASPAVGPTNYKVNFQIGTATGTAVAFPSTSGTGGSVSITVVGTTTWTVKVNWTDIGGEKTVNAGDVITVSWSPLTGIATGTAMTFYLLYSDGSQIQTSAWQA